MAEQTEEQKTHEVAVYKQNRKKTSDLLEAYRAEIEKALPSFLTPERLIRVALTAMSKTPELMNCTQHSVISAVMTCAQLGLMPDGILGEAYLIPFNNTKKQIKECQFIPGYRGLCTLAMRSGQVKSIKATAVYDGSPDMEVVKATGGDFFDYDMGLNEKLDHKPLGLNDPDRISHFYCIVRFLNGGHTFHVMTRAQVEAVRDNAPNYKYAKDKKNTIWHNYFPEMGMKTVCRYTLKYVPMSSEVNRAIGLDIAAEAGLPQNNGVHFLDDIKDDNFTQDISHEIIDQEKDKEAQTLDNAVQNAAAKGEAANKAALEKINSKKAPKVI